MCVRLMVLVLMCGIYTTVVEVVVVVYTTLPHIGRSPAARRRLLVV